MKKFITSAMVCVAIVSMMVLSSCGNSCDANDFSGQVQDAVSELQSAINAYAADPTEANCSAYKDKAQGYLDVVEGFSDCAADIGQGQYDAAIQAARQSVNDITCN